MLLPMPHNPYEVPRHRWFRFGLRSLLIGMALLCPMFAWVGYSLNWIRERRAILEGGGILTIRDQRVPRVDAPCGLWLFGEVGVVRMSYGPGLRIGPGALCQLFPEAKINGPNEPLVPILPDGVKVTIREQEEQPLD